MAVVIRKVLKGEGRRAGLYVTTVISALGKLMLEKAVEIGSIDLPGWMLAQG